MSAAAGGDKQGHYLEVSTCQCKFRKELSHRTVIEWGRKPKVGAQGLSQKAWLGARLCHLPRGVAWDEWPNLSVPWLPQHPPC